VQNRTRWAILRPASGTLPRADERARGESMSIVRSLMRIAGRSSDEVRPVSASVKRIAAEFEQFDDDTARYLAAFAYVLGRVAAVDREVDDDEVAVIKLALVEIAGIDPGHARLVADAAHVEAQEEGGTQDYIATRDFRRVASREQCEQLLRCLLQVAAADGEIEMRSRDGVTIRLATPPHEPTPR
jgi:uncharacterized tellurite resistance protein B-like protein